MVGLCVSRCSTCTVYPPVLLYYTARNAVQIVRKFVTVICHGVGDESADAGEPVSRDQIPRRERGQGKKMTTSRIGNYTPLMNTLLL